MKIRTHYDNLKIARNAPPEIIRAAYKTLSQKYHPDRNPGSAEATRIMAIINAAYDTLSDPYKRQEHDQWIAQQEMMAKQAESRQAAGASPMAAISSSSAAVVQQRQGNPGAYLHPSDFLRLPDSSFNRLGDR